MYYCTTSEMSQFLLKIYIFCLFLTVLWTLDILTRDPDPGSRDPKSTGSRIRISNTDFYLMIEGSKNIRIYNTGFKVRIRSQVQSV
jgi:hypothetical protein